VELAAAMKDAATQPDWIARGIAAASALIALASLTFNMLKERHWGRRITVSMHEENGVLLVNAYNQGNTAETITSWGFRVNQRGRDRFTVEPGTTGEDGPTLPAKLGGSDGLTAPLNCTAAVIIAAAHGRNITSGTVSVRAYVTSYGRARVYAKDPRTLRITVG
jgi:hypothetical protein